MEDTPTGELVYLLTDTLKKSKASLYLFFQLV